MKVRTTANPRDLRGMRRESRRTGKERTVANARPPATVTRAKGTLHVTSTSAARTARMAATARTLRRRLGTLMGVGHALPRTVEAAVALPAVASPGFVSSGTVTLLIFLPFRTRVPRWSGERRLGSLFEGSVRLLETPLRIGVEVTGGQRDQQTLERLSLDETNTVVFQRLDGEEVLTIEQAPHQ
jgi:hypothetical protein